MPDKAATKEADRAGRVVAFSDGLHPTVEGP
jgi:hypothetical protein